MKNYGLEGFNDQIMLFALSEATLCRSSCGMNITILF